jgi:hypothetical protein
MKAPRKYTMKELRGANRINQRGLTDLLEPDSGSDTSSHTVWGCDGQCYGRLRTCDTQRSAARNAPPTQVHCAHSRRCS